MVMVILSIIMGMSIWDDKQGIKNVGLEDIQAKMGLCILGN